jgi:hypothetical protein
MKLEPATVFKTFLEMNVTAIIIHFNALILILYAVIVKSQRFRIYFNLFAGSSSILSRSLYAYETLP